MRFLVAGGAARMGVALGAAILDRGHPVTLADRFLDIDARRAAQWWQREHPGAPIVELRDGNLTASLKPALAAADAIVLVGNPRQEAFDLELTIALADGIVSVSRATPIVRLTSLDAAAGIPSEPVVASLGRARLRDFPGGIPTERTASSLGEADRALRLVATMRDQRCVVLRTAECLEPGRFEFESWEAGCLALLSSLIEIPGIDYSPRTAVDLVDGATLAAAVEKIVHGIDEFDGQIFHLTGGPACRLDLRQVIQQQSLLMKPAPEAAELDLDEYATAAPLEAHLLDDGPSRRALGFSDLTWAPRAIAKFHRFASAHFHELSFPSPRFA